MKKITGISLKIIAGLLFVLLVLIFTIPALFKDKIKTTVTDAINQSVNAKVTFADYRLGFFRNFPNLSFSLENMSVSGTGKFENDTLASVKSIDLVFNLASLFKKSGYQVKSVIIDMAVIRTIVLADGSANWDIMKESDPTETEEESSSADIKILLDKVLLTNSSLSYTDKSSDMEAVIDDLDFNLKGDMTLSETDLQMGLTAGKVTFSMEGMKYLDRATADAKANMKANLDSMVFHLSDNYLTINELNLKFEGMFAMPADDIETDLTFSTGKESFKTLLSMVPAVFLSGYEDLTTEGDFSLSGYAKGVYSDADSTLPDISLDIEVSNGLVSYPALPEKIRNINLKSKIFVDGKIIDKTTVDIDRFHFELAGNPFDMTLSVKTPVSDPEFRGSFLGKIDLTALEKAIPTDSIDLSGIIDMSVNLAGRMSSLENEKYDQFKASGKLNISNMLVAMTGYPEVRINEAAFEFTPAYAAMQKTDLRVGEKSDFLFTGRLENYLPYIFSDDIIRGNLSMHSNITDLGDIMSKMADSNTETEDTAALAIIKIPNNIDFDFNASIDRFNYDKIKAENLNGHIIVKDGVLSLRETGMNILGGKVTMNAGYDTRDSLKPAMTADLAISNLAIKDAFNTFNTVQKLAPAAKGIDGKIAARFSYSSLLGKDFMPVISTITGGGKLQSESVTIVESASYNQMKELLKLGNSFTNTFKDINVNFKISNGRIFVSPFDAKAGSLKMNISGDQGIDQTLNYVVKAEMPRSGLGGSVNALIDNLSAQAASFGIAFKPSDVIKVNVKISGTFTKPVIAPFFGNTPPEGAPTAATGVKETVKQVVDNSVDEAKLKARKEAEVQGNLLIEEAEEKGRQLREEAAKAAEKIRSEADNQGQKLVKEAETKGALAKVAAQKAADSARKEAGRRADQLVKEADEKALKLVEEAKAKKEELINKI